MFRIAWKRAPVWVGKIESFMFDDRVNKSSIVQFPVDNDRYDMFDLVQIDKSLSFSFGEGYSMSPWYRTDLAKITGSKTLTVEMHGAETRLMAQKVSRFYEDATLYDIVCDIGAGWGAVVDCDPRAKDIKPESVSQVGETDAQFLRRLAESWGFFFWLDGDVIRFQSYGRQPVRILDYGDLVEEPDFEFNASMARSKPGVKTEPVTAEKFDKEFYEKFYGVQSIDLQQAKILGNYAPDLEQSDWNKDYERVIKPHGYEGVEEWKEVSGGSATVDEGPATKETVEVKSSNEAARKWRMKKVLKLRVKAIGQAQRRAGESLVLVNAPQIISGEWHIREIKHTWGERDFQQEIFLQKHGFQKKETKKGEPLGAIEEYNYTSSDIGQFMTEVNQQSVDWGAVAQPSQYIKVNKYGEEIESLRLSSK